MLVALKVTGSLSCGADLAREAPVFDQWGKSYFVSSTKPAVILPESSFYFHSDRVLAHEAEKICLDSGMELASMTFAEKMKSFEEQLLRERLRRAHGGSFSPESRRSASVWAACVRQPRLLS